MAFSTQNDFLKIAFLNDRLEPVCARKTGVKLKTYDSSTDSRAWAMNKEKQAHFLADLVACRNYADDKYRGMDASGSKGLRDDAIGDKAEKDSLLEYAQEKLEDIDKMVTENKKLRDQLEMSDEKMAILEDENKKIKGIVAEQADPNKLSPFHQKVRELRNQGKITPEDEKALNEMQKYLGCKDKEYKVLEAENNSLKRLVEKLAARAKVNKIPTEKETSTDVNYLQSTINDLREEVGILRGMEDDTAKMKMDYNALKSKYDSLSSGEKEKRLNQDADKMGAIIDERNNLRDQLAKMIGIEDKIAVLRKRAMEADRLEKELKDLKGKLNDLQQGSKHAVDAINNLAKDRDKMLHGLENDAKTLESCKAERDCLREKCAQLEAQLNEMQQAMEELECLREQNQELCAAIRDAHCKLRKMQCLEQELINTKKRLCRSEHALEDYECQMHQLMDVIEELEAQRCFCCCGDQTGAAGDNVKDGHIQDLINASKLTLQHLQEECVSRIAVEKELERSKHEIDLLKKQASADSEQLRRSSDAKIADLLKQLEKCKADNKKLMGENQQLNGIVKDTESKVGSIREEIKASLTGPSTKEEMKAGEVPVSTSADQCCEEAKMLREQIAQERQKCAAEKSLLENKLQDMTALYTKAKEDCENSKNETMKSAEEVGKLNKAKEESADEIAALNGGLEEQKQLLASAKTELEQYRNELNKCSEKAEALENANKSLQDEIGNLRNGNAELSKQLKDKENEVSALNSKISDLEKQLAACQDKIKNSSDQESKILGELLIMKKSFEDCSAELNKLKAEKNNFNDALSQKDNEIKNAMSQLDKCRADLDALRKELEDKINSLMAEKKALEDQVSAGKADLDQLAKLVADIEAEREKNKKLEAIAQDFENKLKEMPKEVPQAAAAAAGGVDGQVQQAMDQLKGQLERETAKVNDLENQLAKCRQALSEAQAGGAAPVKAMESTVKAIDREKASSLTKMQGIHDNQLQDLIRNHDKEIEALKLANQALRDSLMNLKQGLGGTGEALDMTDIQKQLEELKKGVCECGKKKICPMSKLQEICMKIVEQGIECLNLKELTYLHSEVYKAGLKLKPGLVGSGDKDQQRCCKCTGFSCCLPNIPKDAEKKLLNRIMGLENEVENANKILQHLKQCTEKKKAVAKTSFSAERYTPCRVNDEINEFLKRAKDEKNSTPEVTEIYRKCKKSTSKRKCASSSRDCN